MAVGSVAAAAAALDSGDPRECRSGAEYLARLGTPECLRVLDRALSDGGEHRHQLVIYLSRHAATHALRVRHMPGNADARVRVACAGMLGADGATPAVAELRQALSDPTWEVALAAVVMLMRMGGDEACAALREALANPKWTVRFQACKALVDQGDTGTAVITCLEDLDVSPWARWHNAHALVDRGQEDGLEEPTTVELLARARGGTLPEYGRKDIAAARAYLHEVEARHAEHGSSHLILEELL